MSVEKNSVSTRNSSTRPISNGDSFVGGWEDALHYDTLSITLSASASCTMQIAQSIDGSNLDFTEAIAYITGASISVSRPLTSKYFRVSVFADSGAITTLQLQTIMRLVPAMPTVVAVEPGSDPIVVETTGSSLVNNRSRPYQFIPTAYNSTPAIYADAEQPTITAYGVWNFTNVNPNKINWYLYSTLYQTDLSLSSVDSCYVVIENKAGSSLWPFLVLYSLPDGYGDAQPWYKSRWVFETPAEVLGTDERILLYFGNNPSNVEPLIRHINLPINLAQSAGTRGAGEQIGLIALNTSSTESTGTYDFDLTKFGVNWYSYEDTQSGQRPQGVMIQNDLSELHVSVSPNPTPALVAYRNIDVGLTASLVRLGPTWLHTINVSNDDNNHLFLKLYSQSTAPTELDTPIWTVRVHQNQSNDINFTVPLYSESGFWIRCSTGVADNNTGAPSANGCICNIALA